MFSLNRVITGRNHAMLNSFAYLNLCNSNIYLDAIGAANIYLDGEKARKLPKHRWPVLGAKATFGSSKDFGKVLGRKNAEAVRLPFLT